MTYNMTAFTVKSGETVKLTLKHVGSLPKAVMGHNVVVLAAGEDVEALGRQDAAAVGGRHGLPEGVGIVDGRLVVAEVLLARDAGLGREFRLDRIQISHEVLPGRSCDAPILRHG